MTKATYDSLVPGDKVVQTANPDLIFVVQPPEMDGQVVPVVVPGAGNEKHLHDYSGWEKVKG
jgi:hypothetical protein